MRAIVFDSDVRLEASRPTPTPLEGEVLVRVSCAGICETDLQIIKGYMGFRGVLGHEFVGVAETGPLAGRRVVGEINCSCMGCPTCVAGMPTHCPNRTVLGILNHDGAFADVVSVPQRNLHVVPNAVPDEVAVFTEPLAAAFEIPARLAIPPRARIVVLGDGRLGNLCAQVLAAMSDSVLVVGRHRAKLALLESLGIATALVGELEDTRIADIVVDCTGSATGLASALRLVRPRGTIVFKTTIAGEHQTALAPLVIGEVTVVGSRCGPFEPAIAALAAGRIQVLPLISGRFNLSSGVAALESARTTPVLMILLDVN